MFVIILWRDTTVNTKLNFPALCASFFVLKQEKMAYFAVLLMEETVYEYETAMFSELWKIVNILI